MNLQNAIETIRTELADANISSPVSVELYIALYQESDDKVSIECLHARSRRTDHAHKIRLEIGTNEKTASRPPVHEKSKNSPPPVQKQPPALSDETKKQIDSAIPPLKTLQSVQAENPNYLAPKKRKDFRL